MPEAGATLFEELMRFKPEGLTANGWAVKAGVSRTIWADLRRHGNPSRRTLEKLLGAAGSSLAEFEALRVGQPAPAASADAAGLADAGQGWRGAPLEPIPLFATGIAGQWGDAGSGIDIHLVDRSKVIARLERPALLAADRDSYAVTMVGEAMWPRFRPGRRLLVSPAAAVAVGDDLLLQLDRGEALIGELASRSARSIELRQFNPHVTFTVDADQIVEIHKIVGEAL